MTSKTSTKAPKAAKPPKADEPAAPSPATEPAQLMAPETLARTLRAVAAELERDPALARRVAAAVDQSASGGKSGKAGKGGSIVSIADADDAPVAKAAKVAKAKPFVPRLITGTSPELGTGVPDPFALYRRLGENGLRNALAELRLGTLRAILREYTLDPGGRLSGQNDAERLRAVILDAAKG